MRQLFFHLSALGVETVHELSMTRIPHLQAVYSVARFGSNRGELSAALQDIACIPGLAAGRPMDFESSVNEFPPKFDQSDTLDATERAVIGSILERYQAAVGMRAPLHASIR